MSARNYAHVYVNTGVLVVVDTTYTELHGSMLDALAYGSKWISYQVNESANMVALVKVQGSIDGGVNGTWVDLRAEDNTGVAFGSTAITVSGNAVVQIFVTDDFVTNSPAVLAGYRFYRLVAHNNTSDTAHIAHLQVFGIAK